MRTINQFDIGGFALRQGLPGIAALGFALAILLAPMTARAQRRVGPLQPANGGPGNINLPYTTNDGAGGQWIVDQNGNIQNQGNQPVWGQAAMMTVNGAGASANSNLAQLDPKTGELILDPINYQQCTLQRRVLFPQDKSFVRIIDVFKNTTNQPITITANLRSIINFGVRSSGRVADPKHPENIMAITAMTQVNQAAIEVFAGPGSKVVPNIVNAAQNTNVITVQMQLTIAPGKTAAWMHLLETTATEDQGRQDVLALKTSALMKNLPADVRKAIVNFGGSSEAGVDYELPRDPNFDVVELTTGSQMRGTLKETTFSLTTFYGAIDLPAAQVIGLVNVGEFRPRLLVVMQDGQVFGGTLAKPAIDLELSSGQTVSVPLAQLSKAGYHKRPDEPEAPPADKPYVLMRQGDRMNIIMPTDPIEVMTRYGLLKLDPTTIQTIDFQSDETGVHLITLTDGTKFAGLVTSPDLLFKLVGGMPADGVKVPTSSIVRVALVAKSDDEDDAPPTGSLTLVNQDELVGTLSGQLKLDMSFDTLTLEGAQIRRINRASAGSQDVNIIMWDDSEVNGQLESPSISCKLKSGLAIDVPLALLDEYSNPAPLPSEPIIQKVKETVALLAADDFKQRDAAQESLTAMGPVIAGELQDLRPTQAPEAQQRIDAILKVFATRKTAGSSAGGGPAGIAVHPTPRATILPR